MGKINDLVGKTFNRLTVISYVSGKRKGYWHCQCSCGNTKTVETSKLTSGNTSSCGCFQKESRLAHSTKHGEAHKTKEWSTWVSIRQRCTNPDSKYYHHYGGRGIKMHEEWLTSYEQFLKDAGRAPSPKHSIDRINNNGNYEPGNIRWATQKQQTNNMRTNIIVEHNGKAMTVSQWSDELGFKYELVRSRLKKGWTFIDAITRPHRYTKE